MEGVESAGNKEVKEVPPVPIKTYKWEDVRRARRRGGYPWTYLYKDPFEDLEGGSDDDGFDMESTKSSSDVSEAAAKKDEKTEGEVTTEPKKKKVVKKIVKKKVAKKKDPAEEKSDSNGKEDEPGKSDDKDKGDGLAKSAEKAEDKEETSAPLKKSDGKEESIKKSVGGEETSVGSKTSDSKEEKSAPLKKSDSEEDKPVLLKKSGSKEETLKKSDSKEEATFTIKKPVSKEETLKKSESKEETLKKSDSKEETLKKSDSKEETLKKSDSKEETLKKSDTKEEALKKSDSKEETLEKSDSKEETVAPVKKFGRKIEKSDSKEEATFTIKKPIIKGETLKKSDSKEKPLKKSDSKEETSTPIRKFGIKKDTLNKSDSKEETTTAIVKLGSKEDSKEESAPIKEAESKEGTLLKSEGKEDKLKRSNSKDDTLEKAGIKIRKWKSKDEPLKKSESQEKPLKKSISKEEEKVIDESIKKSESEEDVIKTIQDELLIKPIKRDSLVMDTTPIKDERMQIDDNLPLPDSPDSPDSTNVSISQYLDNEPIIDSKKDEAVALQPGSSKRAKSEEPGRKRKHSIESSYSRVSKYSLSKVGFMKKLKEATDKIKFPKLLSRSESKLNKKAKKEAETPAPAKKEQKLDVKKPEEPVYIYIPLKPPPGEKDEFSDKNEDEDVAMPEETPVKRLTPPLEEETEVQSEDKVIAQASEVVKEMEMKKLPLQESEKKGGKFLGMLGKKSEKKVEEKEEPSPASKLLSKFNKKGKKEEAPVVKKTEKKTVETKEVEPVYIHIPLHPPPGEEKMEIDEGEKDEEGIKEEMQIDESKKEEMQIDESKKEEMQVDQSKKEEMQVDQSKNEEVSSGDSKIGKEDAPVEEMQVDPVEDEKRLERIRKKLERINKLAEEKKEAEEKKKAEEEKIAEEAKAAEEKRVEEEKKAAEAEEKIAKLEPTPKIKEKSQEKELKAKKESMFPSLKFDLKLKKPVKKEEAPVAQAKKEEAKLDTKKTPEPLYIHIPLKPPPGETDEFSHLEFEGKKPEVKPKETVESPKETTPKGVQLIILTGPSEDEILSTPIPETPSDNLDEKKMDELKTIARDVVDRYSPETKRKALKERSEAVDLFEEKSAEKEEKIRKLKGIPGGGEEEDKPVPEEKSKEEKILETQKTDDDKLEERKVRMVVDEEDGLKTEAVIAQIITDEVHEKEKEELKTTESESPVLKKKVSFKRRSKDDDSGVYEDVQIATDAIKPLEQMQSMSVEEEKTYLDEKLIKATSLEEDYNKWSKENDHEYEPVNPPPDSSGFTTPTIPQEEKKPSTPVTDSDIEFLAAKAADFELLSKGITTTKPGGDAVFIPLASVLKEVESEEREKESHAQESHGKKIQEAIKSSASKLHRQASMISNKMGSEAEKIHTRVKSIKRPKFEKPHMPKFQKPKMPTMPKMKKPTMPKMSRPKMPTMPKMNKPKMPAMPKMPESMKKMSMPTFKLPKRSSLGRQRRQLNSSTTESTAGGSRKKIFDFATYPRMFHRKKKESDPEINTPRTGTDITPTSEPSTLRRSFLFGNRWKKGKFTETPAVDVAQGSLMSKASERSDAQGSVRVPLHSETSMDNESLDLRSRVEKEADMLLASGRYDEDTEHEAYMKENQEIHRASSLNAKLNDRWSHGVFHENNRYENEDTSNGQLASSYDNIPRPGVVEQINEDEFIIRQKGISRDNIQVREILTSEIKKSFGQSEEEHYTKPDLGSSDASLPEAPKRRGFKKPKHKKTPHVSHEAITYEPEEPVQRSETDLDRYEREEIEIEQDRRSYQEPERPRRSRSRKDHSLDSEGGRSLEQDVIRPKPMRRSRKDYSLDSQDYEPEISGEATPSSRIVSDENITRPKRRSRSKKQTSLDSYEGGPSYEISAAASYEISGNETPISYEISDENILSGNDFLDYKMYENEEMEGKEQPGIVVSDPYQESLFHPNFDDVPLAPPRKHKSLKSLNASEHDSITPEMGYKEISDQNLDFNVMHEYQIPTPDEGAAPQRPVRTRSRTRSHSRYEEDSISKRTESIISLEPDENLEYIGYSVINKSHKEPKPPRRKRSIKSNQSEEGRKFHTVPRPLNDTQPVRPLRNYSTLGPSRPPRKVSVPNLTDEEKENVSVSPYIEIDDKDLQSGEVIQKMKDRPLPAPPRPPRKSRGRYLRDISQERNIMEVPGMETEASVQTEPLPEGFECEELVQEKDDRVITPSIHKKADGIYKDYEELIKKEMEESHAIPRSYHEEAPRIPRRPVTEYDHQETITHGTLLVQPYGKHENIEETPVQSFEKSTERVITVRREFDDTTKIPADFKKLRDPETTQQPQIIERIIERHIPSQLDSTGEMELIKTHKLQVQDLDVDRLAVNELHANKIKVSEIDSSSITTAEINSNSGNLIVGGIELPASFFQQIVEKLQEQAEQMRPKPQPETEKKDLSTSEAKASKPSGEDKDKRDDFLGESKDIPETGDFLGERTPTAPTDEHFLSEGASEFKKDRDFSSEESERILKEEGGTSSLVLKESKKMEDISKIDDFLPEDSWQVEKEGDFLSEDSSRVEKEGDFVSEDLSRVEKEGDFLSEDSSRVKKEGDFVSEDPSRIEKEGDFLSEDSSRIEKEGDFLSEESELILKEQKDLSEKAAPVQEESVPLEISQIEKETADFLTKETLPTEKSQDEFSSKEISAIEKEQIETSTEEPTKVETEKIQDDFSLVIKEQSLESKIDIEQTELDEDGLLSKDRSTEKKQEESLSKIESQQASSNIDQTQEVSKIDSESQSHEEEIVDIPSETQEVSKIDSESQSHEEEKVDIPSEEPARPEEESTFETLEEVDAEKQKYLEDVELDPELQKQESIVKEYEDIATQMRLEEEKFQETLRKVEEMMRRSEMEEGVTAEEVKEGIASEIDDLITAATEITALREIAQEEEEERIVRELEEAAGDAQKKTPTEDTEEPLEVIELVLEPPQRPKRSKHSKLEKDLTEMEICDLDKPEMEVMISPEEEEIIRLLMEDAGGDISEVMIIHENFPVHERAGLIIEEIIPGEHEEAGLIIREIPEDQEVEETGMKISEIIPDEKTVPESVLPDVQKVSEVHEEQEIAEDEVEPIPPVVPKRKAAKAVEKVSTNIDEEIAPSSLETETTSSRIDEIIPGREDEKVPPIDERILSSTMPSSDTVDGRILSSSIPPSETIDEIILSSTISPSETVNEIILSSTISPSETVGGRIISTVIPTSETVDGSSISSVIPPPIERMDPSSKVDQIDEESLGRIISSKAVTPGNVEGKTLSKIDTSEIAAERIPSKVVSSEISDVRIPPSEVIPSEIVVEKIPPSKAVHLDGRTPSSGIDTKIPSEAPEAIPTTGETRFKVEPSDESPPPRPPQPTIDASDYIPSQPPASFFALRSPPAFRDFDVDDDIPIIPRRRRHHKTLVQTPSSSDEVHPSTRRRQRTPEPSIPQLTSQLTRACLNAADKSLRRLIQQITNKVLGSVDEKQDVNVIVVILLVLIACLIILSWENSKQVHHHHWEFFNPPRDL